MAWLFAVCSCLQETLITHDELGSDFVCPHCGKKSTIDYEEVEDADEGFIELVRLIPLKEEPV